jgi:hypothetical protein
VSYIWQRWLADEFRAAGLTVIEVAGWQNRGRPATTGAFHPDQGITNHHTGTTTSAANPGPTLRLLIEGRSDLPGPLCQWTVRYDGVVVVVAAGRANHAGRVGKPGQPGMPLGADGNSLALGDEVDTNGTQTLPEAQRRSIAITNAVALRHYNNPTSRVHRHADISGTGKWDIGNATTQQLRDEAAGATTKPKDWFDMATEADLKRIVNAAVAAAVPDIAKAVMTARVANRNPGSDTQTDWTLHRMLTHLETQQDANSQALARLEAGLKAAVAEGKSAGA